MAKPAASAPVGVGGPGFLSRFAGPAAFSQVVVQPILAFLSVNFFAGSSTSRPASLEEGIAVVAVATVVAWLFFTLSGVLINALLPYPTGARAVSVAVVFAATEFIRVWTINGLLADDNLEQELGAAFLTVGSLTTGVALLGMASVAVNDYREYRESYRNLALTLMRLRSIVQETQANIALVRDQLAHKVRTLLVGSVHDAFHHPDATVAAPAEIAEELFRIADDIVRPLSHQVYDDERDYPLPTVQEAPPRVSAQTFFNDVTSAAPFQPVAHTVLVTLVLSPALVALGTLSAVLWLMALSGVVFALAWLGRRFLATRLATWPVVVRVGVITVAFMLPVSLYLGGTISPALFGPEQASGLFAYGAVLGAVLGWLPAIAEGLRHSRRRFLDDLEPLDRELEWFRVRAQSQLWRDQKRLALTLHSDVQSTILAAAMQLNRAVANDAESLASVVTSVEDSIREALTLERPPDQAANITGLVAAINLTWSSVLTLELIATPAVLAVIERDDLARDIVPEVIKELHINAFKHGKATSCVVTLIHPTPSTVGVKMCNNGRPFPEHPQQQGLGDRFLTAVSLERKVSTTPEGVCVELTLPVATEASKPQPVG